MKNIMKLKSYLLFFILYLASSLNSYTINRYNNSIPSFNSDEGVRKLIPVEGSRVAIRPLPISEYVTNFEEMKFCLDNTDMTYEGLEFGKYCNVAFREYYVGWQEGEMDTNPETNEIVRIIREKESKGINLYGFKISRETMVGKPAGPIPTETRILFQSDVDAIRKVIKDAKKKGFIKRDDYKLIQMVDGAFSIKTPDNSTIIKDSLAQSIIKSMDGLCIEIHHFFRNGVLPQIAIDETIKEAKWALDNNLEFVFYYGPYMWVDCEGYKTDLFRDWLKRFWDAGLPKHNKKIIYDMNAFPFGCGKNRPIVPEDNSQSVTGLLKWLIEEVKYEWKY